MSIKNVNGCYELGEIPKEGYVEFARLAGKCFVNNRIAIGDECLAKYKEYVDWCNETFPSSDGAITYGTLTAFMRYVHPVYYVHIDRVVVDGKPARKYVVMGKRPVRKERSK